MKQLNICALSRIIVVGFIQGFYDIQPKVLNPIHSNRLEFHLGEEALISKNMIGCSHIILATIATDVIYCQTSSYHSLHGSHLYKTIDNFPSSVEYKNNVGHRERQPVQVLFPVNTGLESTRSMNPAYSIFSNCYYYYFFKSHCIIQSFYCCHEKHDQTQLGEERVYTLPFIINPLKAVRVGA